MEKMKMKGITKEMAEGGEVGEDDELMDHIALEAIHAVHNRDHDSFKNSMHVMIAHTIQKLSDEMDMGE